jgi:hypothetical protein
MPLHPEFKPELTPRQMLEFGVFGGHYWPELPTEFPAEWFGQAKLSPEKPDPACNCFGVLASQSLETWQAKGWIYPGDPCGWFQWYCRYFQGRRIPFEDERQVKRWKAMRRHQAQIQHNCKPGDLSCRPRQRQALLQWAYDSTKM